MTRQLYFFLWSAWLGLSPALFAIEPWQAALARMPLRTNVTELNQTNAIPLLLASFRENATVKALIFMPGATDEFYFFQRGVAQLPADKTAPPTLLDAVTALTEQTLLCATFRPPFVLLHSAEDPLEPSYKIEHEPTARRLRQKKFVQQALYFDRDWDFLQPLVSFHLDTKFLPPARSMDSWHFYRHSLVSWNLTGWEALEALALAGKTTFTVGKRKVVFAGDKRFRARPAVPLP